MSTLDPRALVTVPRKPTWQQLEQAAHNLSDGFGAEFVIANEAFAMAVYDEMLAAAPSAQSQPQADEPVAKVLRKGFSAGDIILTQVGYEADLPDGTVLYASPQPALAVKGDDAKDLLMRECIFAAQEARKSNGHDTYSSRVLDKAASYLLSLVASPLPSGEVDDIAARLWRAEAEDSGTPASVVNGRTREAFEDQSPNLKDRWRKFARAALPDSLSIAPATADGWRLEPYLWQCKDYADGWLSYANEDEAQAYQRDTGCAVRITYRPLPAAPTATGGR